MADVFNEKTVAASGTMSAGEWPWGWRVFKTELSGRISQRLYLTNDGEPGSADILGTAMIYWVEVFISDRGDDRSFNQVHSSGVSYQNSTDGFTPTEASMYSFDVVYDSGVGNWFLWIRGALADDFPQDDGSKRVLVVHILAV